MAEALLELEQILFSRKEALTSEEDRLLNSWKQNAIRDFGIGAVGAFIATWLVTRRLNNLVRMNLTAGVGFYYGFRRFDQCVDSEVEQILSQHGTRLQTGLAEIVFGIFFKLKAAKRTIHYLMDTKFNTFPAGPNKVWHLNKAQVVLRICSRISGFLVDIGYIQRSIIYELVLS